MTGADRESKKARSQDLAFFIGAAAYFGSVALGAVEAGNGPL